MTCIELALVLFTLAGLMAGARYGFWGGVAGAAAGLAAYFLVMCLIGAAFSAQMKREERMRGRHGSDEPAPPGST